MWCISIEIWQEVKKEYVETNVQNLMIYVPVM